MIPLISICLAVYEALALTTGRAPTITTLSARKSTGALVFAWWIALGLHFLDERRKR